MKISSKTHAQAHDAQLLILDVIADEKPFFAAVVIGDLRARPPTTKTELGNECLRRLTAAQEAFSNNKQAVVVEVRSPGRAAARVASACATVERHGAAAIFCLDAATRDAVVRELNAKA